MNITVTFEGQDKVVSTAEWMLKSAETKTMKLVYTQMQRTLRKAIGYTPVKTGALRSSGHVELGNNYVSIIFGGPSADYAIYVHEITHYRHPVGQAKFLERAVMEDEARILAAAAKALSGRGK